MLTNQYRHIIITKHWFLKLRHVIDRMMWYSNDSSALLKRLQQRYAIYLHIKNMCFYRILKWANLLISTLYSSFGHCNFSVTTEAFNIKWMAKCNFIWIIYKCCTAKRNLIYRYLKHIRDLKFYSKNSLRYNNCKVYRNWLDVLNIRMVLIANCWTTYCFINVILTTYYTAISKN